MSDKPLTAEVLADALGCFSNAAIGAMHANTHPVACIAIGLDAVAWRLREHAEKADQKYVQAVTIKIDADAADQRGVARIQGFTGDVCPDCGNYTMVRNGSCLKCQTCGSTTGCS